ncbi:MAG TPA: hypothetical protein VLK35_01085 [Methylomirabilota bacterium]|nr:hypothetical protein [Methylomirabilota bacterium]
MSTPGRIVAIAVVAILVLAVAVLELISERVRVGPAVEPYLADRQTDNRPGIAGPAPREIESIIVLRSGRPADSDPEP